MKKISVKFCWVSLLFLLLGLTATAYAVPNLQLDIVNADSYYDNGTDTIVTTSYVFTVRALLKDSTMLEDTFNLSAAVRPKIGPDSADLGLIEIDSIPYNVTGDMVYGVPPLEQSLDADHDGNDLGKHDIYETYFKELSFTFNSSNTVNTYNTETGSPDNDAPFLYFKDFSLDVTGLSKDYGIHFDLYKTEIQASGDIDIDLFAPFSHDAEVSNGGGGGGSGSSDPIPESSTILLLGAGLAFFACRNRSVLKK